MHMTQIFLCCLCEVLWVFVLNEILNSFFRVYSVEWGDTRRVSNWMVCPCIRLGFVLAMPQPCPVLTAVGEEQPTEEEQEQDQPQAAEEEVDVQAHVAAALTRIMAAAGPPPTTEALEEEDQRRLSDGAHGAMEQDEEPEFLGAKEAHEVGPQELGVADKAGPKTGEVETCRHWAKG